MTKSINIWLGLDIDSIEFEKASIPVDVANKEGFILDGPSSKILVSNNAYFYLPENESSNPVDVIREFINDTQENEFINFSTHSTKSIDCISKMIQENVLNYDSVTIYLLNETNSTINAKASFDENGGLKDWLVGFTS